MTTFYLYVGAVATYFLSILMVIVFAPLGILGVIGAGLAFLAAHVLWMVYLRKVCLFFKDPTLAGSVLTNLIVQLVVPVAGSIFVVGLMFALHSAGQAGVLISSCFTLLLFVAMLGIFIWYLMILRNVRDLVDR